METPHPPEAPSLPEQARWLAEKLDEERSALQALEASIESQMVALRARESAEVRESTISANERLHVLTRLHEEQEAMLAGIAAAIGWEGQPATIRAVADHLEREIGDHETAQRLRASRTSLMELAAETKEKSEELAYTLQYALHLGKELIQTVQSVHQPEPVSLYTPRGKTTIGGKSRPIVNRMG